MMNTLNFFLKRIKLFTRLDPERDWITLLIGSIIMLFGIVVWNAWAFDTIARGGTIGPSAATTPPIFNQSSIEDVRSIFERRATEEANYTLGVYQYLDPSL